MPVPVFAPRRVQVAGGPSEVAGLKNPTRLVDVPATGGHGYAREAAALVLLASALFAALALASFRADPLRPELEGGDWVGPAGAAAAAAAIEAVGVSACFFPLELALLAAPLLDRRPSRASVARIAGDIVVVFILAALSQVAFPHTTAFGSMPVGGAVGELFGEVLRTLFSTVGSYIIGFTIVALILIGRAQFSFIDGVKRLEAAIVAMLDRAAHGSRAVVGAWAAARAIDAKRDAEQRSAAAPRIALPPADEAIIAALTDEDAPESDRKSMEIAVAKGPGLVPALFERTLGVAVQPAAPADGPRLDGPRILPPPPEAAPQLGGLADEVVTPSPIAPTAAVSERIPLGRRAASEATPPAQTPSEASSVHASPTPDPVAVETPEPGPAVEPTIVDTSAAQRTVKAAPVKVVPAIGLGFRLPSTTSLEPAETDRAPIDHEQLRAVAVLLEKTLSDYGVSGKVEEILPGPTVTTFEVSPAAGTKVSKVAGLADDLALGLSRKVRIIAPIPGKNRIGFEIPNEHRIPVNLRELIEDRRFQEMRAPLPCVLGRDIIGTPYFADLASMPHVIVAGATGAGKSVGLNVMLVSLLFRKTPAELRLLMIDPKVVELAPFDRIPHMLLPVVTDMKMAANALKWAVDEMERRYQLFANAGTKNITTYNGWVERVLRGEARPPKPPARVAAVGPDGLEVEVNAAKDGSDAALPEKIPFIVIVVDEFADLMMQQGKDVEASVARLAQKARAAGMHVILATQRPSVDVITGMIKANFPTRIAFRVAQKVDSRTILDEQGAEHLLGRGDMLIKMNGANDTRRVQCPFCSEEEVQRITDFLRLQGEPVYDEAILKPRDDEGADAQQEDAESDPMYDAAVRIVADTRRCSTSWIQRKLGVGYNRAAKIVEAMEKRGVVGPANGAKDREVLIGPL
jgi:S-DNA-T family DNA segregation ATPase FtsK/SpoIIIE